jgi:hypothetical protein
MLNFVGQDIQKGSFVVQIARTNQGVVKRAGVVLGVTMTDEGSLFRTGWYDRETPNVHAKESSVKIDGLVLIDPNSLPNNIRNILEYVKTRGTVS